MDSFAQGFTSFKCLTKKEVVNCSTGERLGYITDAEFDTCTGEIKYFIATSEKDPFGIKGREMRRFAFCDISRIGDDIIIVNRASICVKQSSKRKKLL